MESSQPGELPAAAEDCAVAPEEEEGAMLALEDDDPPFEITTDFSVLAAQDEQLKPYVKHGHRIDFQDPAAMRALSKATLNVDFDLKLQLPADKLCPPVPNRWAYVTWIQRLLDSTNQDYRDGFSWERQVTGLDIGTGASAIYALLMLRTRPKYIMCTTEINKTSHDSAILNLVTNGFAKRAKPSFVAGLNRIVPMDYLGNVDKLDFVMCNPPFYSSVDQWQSALTGEGKSWAPNAVCTGDADEMMCDGGDLGFINRMIDESSGLKDKVTWFTSMVGKLDSLKQLVKRLKLPIEKGGEFGLTNYAIGSIREGNTKRWLLAWSFKDFRPINDVARYIAHYKLLPKAEVPHHPPHDLFPAPTEDRIFSELQIDDVVDRILRLIDELPKPFRWEWDEDSKTGLGITPKVVWGRRFRRVGKPEKRMVNVHGRWVEEFIEPSTKARQESPPSEPTGAEMEDGEVVEEPTILAVRIYVFAWEGQNNEGHDKKGNVVLLRWLRGERQKDFQSFYGLVHRELRGVEKGKQPPQT